MKTNLASQSAFTLTELLVVIAIIGTLSVVISSFAITAKSKASGVECTKNLSAWTRALAMYVDSGRIHVVPPLGSGEPADAEAWYNVLAKKLDEKALMEYQSGENLPRPKGGFKSTYVCPDATRGNSGGGLFSYAYNKRFVKDDKRLRGPQIRHAAELVAFMDAPNPVNPSADETDMVKEDTAAFRHGGKANIAFYDGHVSSFRLREVQAGVDTPNKVNDYGILWDSWPVQ